MSLPQNIEIATVLTRIEQLREFLDTDDANVRLRLNTIEGESDALELIDEVIEIVRSDEAFIEEIKRRTQRLEVRADRGRKMLRDLMEKIGVKRLQRPLATLSISLRNSLHVTDEKHVPPRFWKSSVDRIALKKALQAGEDVPGATLGNAYPSLTLRKD
jgi:DNA gyrase/topoisomerase IV subunit A